MKRAKTNWILIGSFTALAFGLVLSGCGQNRAQESQAATEPRADLEAEAPVVATAEEDSREEELTRREQALEQRIRELERRVEPPAPVAVSLPPASPAPRVPALPAPRTPEPLAQAPSVVWVTLPAATPFEVELLTPLSSENNLVGDPVEAVVTRDVIREGRAVIPAGSRLSGTVSDVAAVKKIGGQARLAVDFDRLETIGGQTVAVRAYLDSAARSQKKKDAATIGGSAAGGALLGRVLSDGNRSRGTVLGAIVGAAVGTAIAANNDAESILIEPGTVTELQFDAPVELAVDLEPGDVDGPFARS